MTAYVKLPKKQLYGILVCCAVVIFAASLEVLFRVKDMALFEAWLDFQTASGLDLPGTDFNTYVSLQLGAYFMQIVIPISYALYAYFAYTKIRINQLFVFIWAVLVLGSLAYSAVGSGFNSIFMYLYIPTHLALLYFTLSLTQVIREYSSPKP